MVKDPTSSILNDPKLNWTYPIWVPLQWALHQFHKWIHYKWKYGTSNWAQTSQFTDMTHMENININSSCWGMDKCSNNGMENKCDNLNFDIGLHNNQCTKNKQTSLKVIFCLHFKWCNQGCAFKLIGYQKLTTVIK